MGKTIIVNSRGNFGAPGTTTAGAIQYWKMATTPLVANATESVQEIPYYASGIISKLYVRILANSTSLQSTLTVRKNRVDTVLKVTIPAGAIGEFEDTVNTVAFTSGDKLDYRTVSGGTGTFTISLISVIYDATNTCVSKFSYVLSNFTQASTTQYFPITGTRSGPALTEVSVENRVKVPGLAKNVYVQGFANAKTTPTSLTLRKNGAATAITFTYASGENGLKEDTVNPISYAADDEIVWQVITGAGAGTEGFQMTISVDYETATGNGFITAGSTGATSDITVSPSVTEYYTVGGATIEGTTNEADAQMKVKEAFTFSNLTVYARANTITAPSTFTLRKNGVDTAATVTIGASATGFFVDSTHNIDFASDDLISYKLTTGSTGTTLTIAQMAVWTLPLIAVSASGGGSQGRPPLYRQVKRREPDIAIAIVRVRISLECEVEKLSVQVKGPVLVPQKPLIKYASAVLSVIERILPLPIKPTPLAQSKIVRVSIPLTYEVTNLQLKAGCSYEVERLFTQDQQHKIVATSINFLLSDLI